MGLFDRLLRRTATDRPAEPTPRAKPEAALERPRRMSAGELAAELFDTHGAHPPTDALFNRAQEEGLDVRVVDERIDALAERAAITVQTIERRRMRIVDLSELDAVRLRIRGSAHYLTYQERDHFGGRTYVLVRERDNPHDANAVAVYGRGRKVGYITEARATTLAPLLDTLAADGYRVRGEGTSASSSRMWVWVPRADALRRYARAQGG